MKKVSKILAITLGVILLLLLVTPVLFKGKIEAVVKEKVNEQIHATVDWSKFGLSFFRGFPDLSISLHQVSVVGIESFAGDTLAGLQRFELRVNPFSAIRKNLVVKSVLVEHPLINGIVLEDGSANWDITDETTTSEVEVTEDSEEASESSMAVSLKRFAITDGRIYYTDQSSDMDASLEGLNLELRGDLSMEQTELKISAGIERINATMGGIRYLRDAVFSLDLLAAANLVENRYTLKENLISLNGLALGAEGEVQLLDEGAMDMNMSFFSRETTFKTLLSLVPAVYLQDFETLETSGSLQLDGTVSGTMKDSLMPDVILNLQVKDGYFSYPDLPRDVSDVQVSLNVDYRGADMDATRVDLKQFHLILGGNPFDLSMQVDHPVSDMHVAGRAEGSIDFSSLQDVVPMEEVSMEGKLETDLRWDTKLSYIEEERFEEVDLEGRLMIEGMRVEAPDIPVPVILEKVSMLFNPRTVELSTFDMMLGSSDIHMNGELENFIPYVFDGQTVSGRLSLSSSLMDTNELLPEEEAGQTDARVVVSDSIVPVPPDSLAEPLGIKIPENIDFAVAVDVHRIEYENIEIENMKGSMHLTGGVAGMEHLEMDVIEGSVISSGWIDTRGEFAEADFFLEMEGVDISSAYETFMSVEKLVPMAKYVKGKANIDMEYHSLLDNTLTPLFESIDAKGDAYTKGLKFQNLEEFVPLTEVLKNEKFSNMAPGEVDVGFTVRDGRIIFNPFEMDVFDSKITVSGSHGLDLSMDYTMDMNIAKSDLGTGANDLIQGMTLLAAGAGLKIPQSDYIKVMANLGGTFNRPKMTTDLSGNLKSGGEAVQAAVEEKITEEVEKVEEQVRDEAGEKAEKLIDDAEIEAARLVEEARKAGEVLVKEAESQGEKLVEDAGSNPLKQVAARTAATELKRQAEKQSVNLVNEAEKKGDEIVQKARDEAAKI